jgi:hypothetical protein
VYAVHMVHAGWGALGVVLGAQLALGAAPARAQTPPPAPSAPVAPVAPAAPPAVSTPPPAAPTASTPVLPWDGPWGNPRMVLWFTSGALAVLGSISLAFYVQAQATAQNDTLTQQQATGGKSACNPAARSLPEVTCMALASEWQSRDQQLAFTLGFYIPSALVLASSMFLPWAKDPAKHVFTSIGPGKSVVGAQGAW